MRSSQFLAVNLTPLEPHLYQFEPHSSYSKRNEKRNKKRKITWPKYVFSSFFFGRKNKIT